MKKPVKKDWIEEQIVRLLQGRILNDDVIRVIVDAALDLQEREKDDSVLRGFEAELSDVKRAIANIITAIEQGIITPSTKARLDELEGRRVDLENAIEDEKCQQPQLTREQLTFWLERFRDGDPSDPKFRETFIEVFVSKVYLYDDHFRAVCNFTGDQDGINYDFVNDLESWGDAGEVFDFEAPSSTIKDWGEHLNRGSLFFCCKKPCISVRIFAFRLFWLAQIKTISQRQKYCLNHLL